MKSQRVYCCRYYEWFGILLIEFCIYANLKEIIVQQNYPGFRKKKKQINVEAELLLFLALVRKI